MKLGNRKEQFRRFFKSKKENYFCKIQSRVIVLALQGPLMVLSKCVKFQSNIIDSLGEKVNNYINLNIGLDADDDQVMTIVHLFFKNR